MSRLYILILLLIIINLARGQGIGEFASITQSFDENNYRWFLSAAREDGDSTKVVMLKALYGRYLVHQQRYPEAEEALYESLDIIRKMEGDLRYSIKLYSPSLYDGYDYLGEYYTQTGDYKKAEYFLQQSEQLRALHFQRGSPHRIFNLQNIAEFYLAINETEKGETYLIKLNHDLNRTKFNNEKLKSAYGTYYRGMTEVCIRQGRLSESKSFLKKYVKFKSSAFTSYRKGILYYGSIPEITYFRSQILLMEGNPTEALQIVGAGIHPGIDSITELPSLLQTKAICLYQLKKNSESLAVARTLLDVHLHNINKVFYTLSEGEKETMFNRTRNDFDLYNSLVIAAIKENNLNNDDLMTLMSFRLQTKALLLNNLLKIRQAIYESNDSSLIHDYRRLSQLKNKVSREVFRKSSKKEMEGYEEEIKSLEKSVSRRVAQMHRHETQIQVSDIQKKLGPQDAAIEMIRVRQLGIQSRIKENDRPRYTLTDTVVYFPIIITSENIQYAIESNGNELEGKYYKLFRNEVMVDQVDTTLYSVFWGGVGSKVKGFSKIFLSGDGVYNQININLLQNRDGYIEDQKEIVLFSNLKDIFTTDKKALQRTAAFFGEPNFQLSENPTGEADAKRDVPNFQMEALKEVDFKDLPGTKVEISNGSQILSSAGWRTQSFLGNEASENKLKSLKNPSLLHIATHGFFVEGTGLNPMLRSGLIFSGVKSTEEYQGEDGILTAYEASSLSLDSTSLVVLSACETGTGEVKTGEGVYGLQRAFLIAGAHNIIMSLWKVDDLATEKLMTFFYKNLVTEKNVRTAFVSAQRSLRKEYPQPFYWGAFILIGE